MIYLIGMGPGNIKNLTVEAVDILKSSSRIISFGRIGETAEELGLEVEKVSRIAEIKDMLIRENESTEDKKTISILASGDPGFYGILEYLKREEIGIVKVIPGVSSIQYMMAKLQKSWHGANLLSFHGREEEREEKILKIIASPMSIILTDSKNNPDCISKTLYARGGRGSMYAGFNLSYEDELIVKVNIGDEINHESPLAVVLLEIKDLKHNKTTN